MRSILDIITEISNEPSKNAKVELVGEHLDNPLFVKVLDASLDPYKTYHIKKIPTVKDHTGSMGLIEFLDNLPKFENREVTGNAARDLLGRYLTNLNADDAEIAIRVIRRSLKAGFDASTVNKAKPGTIAEYPVLLATKQSPAALKKLIFPAFAQIKADGMRANVFIMDGKVTVRGRSGKPIDLMGRFDFLAEFSRNNIMLDGELVIIGEDGKFLPRAKGNGMINKAITGTVTEEIADSVIFIIWDAVALSEFNRPSKKAPKNATPYNIRWETVKSVVKEVNSPKIRSIECRMVNSFDEIDVYYDYVRSLGEEGLIVKNMFHPWENRRSEHLVKFKAKYDCDLEVIGWNYGTEGDRFEHTLGSLICASSDRKVVVGVSWFSDELRAEIFENFDNDWMGRIVAVSYNARTSKDGSDIDSLSIPGFLERREDKDVADSSDDIVWGLTEKK